MAKLIELLKNCAVKKIIGQQDLEITSLAHSEKNCVPGTLFFCITGTKVDGHNFAAAAAGAGAVAVVCERELPGVKATQVIVQDSRSAMALIAGNFYGNPIKRMKLIGITGTNGKTTTSYLLKAIGEAAGKKVGLIGTTGVYIDGVKSDALLTTPDPIDLHNYFFRMAECGTDWVVMEVSAHALDQRKMDGIVADIAVFTNLTQDHLDYFGTTLNYKAAKKKFFTPQYAKAAVINIDDKLGQEIFAEKPLPLVTYGNENPADAFAIDYNAGSFGIKYVLNVFDKLHYIEFALPGKFNMYNSMCAILTAYLMHIPLEVAAKGVKSLTYVPGRFNVALREPFMVIVDYAHTPDGIINILTSIKEFAPGRIITVFGCGGDRDKTKRPLMGAAAAQLSDYLVVTSDNPRSEDPEEIISHIVEGIKDMDFSEYITIPERKSAIKFALDIALPGDVVLVAGKGDERYQEIGGRKIPFYDMAVINDCLKARGII